MAERSDAAAEAVRMLAFRAGRCAAGASVGIQALAVTSLGHRSALPPATLFCHVIVQDSSAGVAEVGGWLVEERSDAPAEAAREL